jgi:hypothetical protein
MLYSRPTRQGAGVIVFGDPDDLKSLLATIRNIYDGPPFKDNLEEFLYDIAHEIDSASGGALTPMPKRHLKPLENYYYWFIRSWPRFLMELAMLRWGAGFHPTSRRDQANIYALEHCAEVALSSYHPVVGPEVMAWLECFGGIPASYLVNFVDEVEARYVSSSMKGKSRFARLPAFMRMLGPSSSEYAAFEKAMAAIAKEKGCQPIDLGRERMPKFAW